MKPNDDPKELMAEIRAICMAAKAGAITYDQCKERCKPLLDKVNAGGKVIAKKYGKRWSNITITGLLR